MAADGFDVYETADRRGRSFETIKVQRRSVLAKLDARNMTEAVAIGFRTGLLA
jgi:DNA-binding NarL/FixJ family response regulator